MTTTKFTDMAGREWDCGLTIASASRLSAECGVKLSGKFEGIDKVTTDPCRLDALTVLLRPQMERAGVTADDFAESLNGDTLQAAADAFVEAVIAFQPAKKRESFRAAYSAALQIQDAAFAELTRRMESLDAESLLKSAAV